MPFLCHAVPLRVQIVSFLFDLHSAAVFDSHMPCRSRTTPRPCSSGSDFPRPRHSAVWAQHVHSMACVNYHRSCRDGMWATCPRSASSGYHAEFHQVRYQKHTNPLNCRASISDISGYHADFYERHGTVGDLRGRCMAYVKYCG
jgi:hypothetical protein